ncbi:TraB/GumN family protein [Kiloniella sp.]|uniref:TraB/GumN family protein n=1 Tax=Kiloniella sp. TaxID=1938587 RepID=UPI003B01EDCD
MSSKLSNRFGLEFTRNIYITILPLLALFFVLVVFGQNARSAELPYGQGVLWQVTKDGLQPSVIFGTMNSSERRVVDLGEGAVKFLASSDSLLVDVIDDDSIKQKLFAAMVYQDNRRLDELVSPETFEKIKVLGYEYGYLARQMKVLKPWAAGVVFSFPPSEASRISLGIRTLNQNLQDIAQQKGIAVIALETVEQQLAALDGANEQEQIALLDTLPSDIASVEEKFEKRLGLYLLQNTGEMYQQMLKDYTLISGDFAERYVASLITHRNYGMVARMQHSLLKGNSFVAIDALHLPGAEGVLSLLVSQGYTIKPLMWFLTIFLGKKRIFPASSG